MGEKAHKMYHQHNRLPCLNSKEMVSILSGKPCESCTHSTCDLTRQVRKWNAKEPLDANMTQLMDKKHGLADEPPVSTLKRIKKVRCMYID